MVTLKFQGEESLPPLKGEASKEEPLDETLVSLEAYKPFIDRNLFDSQAVSGGDKTDVAEEELTTILTGEAVATTLSIKLKSTFSVGAGMDSRSSASIEGGQAKVDTYTVNDTKQFHPDTKILKILYDRVEFTNKGRLEYVMLEDFTKGSVTLGRIAANDKEPREDKKNDNKEDVKVEQTSEGKFVIDRAEIEAALADIDKLLTQVRAVPHFKDGNQDGLKLLSVRSGSIFSSLGLKRGDILQKINGNELDLKRAAELFTQLKNENQIVMEIERKGTPQKMEYEIR